MVNVCIIVRDRPVLTEQTLRSLRNTQVEGTVMILDDGSLDPTMEICLAYNLIPHPTLRFALTRNAKPTGSAGTARNQCIRKSQAYFGRGDLLYTGDNDCFFERGWLERMIGFWESAKACDYAIIGGCQHPYHHPVDPNHPGEICGPEGYWIIENLALPSQSWLMEWSTWDRFGHLAENQGVRQSEDWEFTQKVRAAGMKVGHVKPFVVLPTSRTDTFGVDIPGADRVENYQGVVIL